MSDAALKPGPKRRLLLACLLLAVALALLWVRTRNAGGLFADLEQKAARIEISDAADRMILVRGPDDNWLAASLGDVQADESTVMPLLTALRKAGQNTAEAASSVAPSGNPTQVRIFNRDQQIIADLVLTPDHKDGDGRWTALSKSPARTLPVEDIATLSSEGQHWVKVALPRLASGNFSHVTIIDAALHPRGYRRASATTWEADTPTAAPADLAPMLETLAALRTGSLRSTDAVNWFNAVTLVIDTSEKTQITCQIRLEQDVSWMRCNGAALPGAPDAARQWADDLNKLRRIAFAIQTAEAQRLLVSDQPLHP